VTGRSLSDVHRRPQIGSERKRRVEGTVMRETSSPIPFEETRSSRERVSWLNAKNELPLGIGKKSTKKPKASKHSGYLARWFQRLDEKYLNVVVKGTSFQGRGH